jgi:hypothetical protein
MLFPLPFDNMANIISRPKASCAQIFGIGQPETNERWNQSLAQSCTHLLSRHFMVSYLRDRTVEIFIQQDSRLLAFGAAGSIIYRQYVLEEALRFGPTIVRSDEEQRKKLLVICMMQLEPFFVKRPLNQIRLLMWIRRL